MVNKDELVKRLVENGVDSNWIKHINITLEEIDYKSGDYQDLTEHLFDVSFDDTPPYDYFVTCYQITGLGDFNTLELCVWIENNDWL